MRARWRVVLVLGVLTLVYFGLQRVGGMSDRFFASTLDGANGLVRYLVGDYIGAQRGLYVQVRILREEHERPPTAMKP